MSLINQMLKDLAKTGRRTAQPESLLSGLQESPQSMQKKKFNKQWTLTHVTLVFLISISVTFVCLQLEKKVPKIRYSPLILPSIKTMSPAKNSEVSLVPPLHPVTMTAMTFQPQQDMTLLRFLLTADTFYRIASDHRLNQLIITLANTHFSVPLPKLDYSYSALNYITMTNEKNGNLKIILSLRPGVEVKNLELIRNDTLSELQVRLIYNKRNLSADNSETNNPASLKKSIANINPEEQYQQAVNAFSQGNNTYAIRELSELLDQMPTYHKARAALVGFLLEQGQKDQAQSLLKKGLMLAPNHIPYLELQARILINNGEYAHAYKLLKQVEPSFTRYPDYYALLAAVYQHRGQSTLAAQVYRELVAMAPNQPKWWVGLGVALESLGKKNEAREAYKHASNTSDNLSPELRAYLTDRMQNL